MKHVFVYGILQQNESAEHFGITEEHLLGKAILEGFKRYGLSVIKKSDTPDKVTGEVLLVPDDLEQALYRFEAQFGYTREKVSPQLEHNGEKVDCIAYLV